MSLRSYIEVNGRNKFTYGFSMGKMKDQQVLRQSAVDVVKIQLLGKEKLAAIQQFNNIPTTDRDSSKPLVLFGDLAKNIAANLQLME